ncbi:hypothetical protein AB0J83_41450 [Actinoplanes sp. NPDC049596]|uniref:hypothetical protein n=1 Tax=unclassified Actinoplanes TaxID=2626549 RepID=UPI0034161777
MARDVEAEINVKDNSDRGLKSFHDNMTKADREAHKLQDELDKAAKSTGKFGSAADRNARSVSKLTREIGIAKHELGSLARAFADAGTASERIDISKAIRKQQTEIRNLTKNRDLLKDLIPDVPSAGIAGSLKQALVIGAGAAAPVVGALVSAAVIGGAGVGGVAGGIALAAKDQRVQAAFSGFTDGLSKRLEKAALPFVDTTIAGIDKIEGALDTIDFEQIFADSAKFVEPLAKGVQDFIVEVGDGLETLIAKGGPVIEALSSTFSILGESTGSALETIAGGSEQAADALEGFAVVAGGAIETAGYLVRGLTELSAVTGYVPGKIYGLLESLGYYDERVGSIQRHTAEAASGARDLGNAFDEHGLAITSAGEALLSFDERMRQVYDTSRNLFDAQTDSAAAFDKLKESIKDNGKTLDANTEKGRANRDALSGLAGALNANYAAYVAVNGEGKQANGIATSNYNSFIKAATGLGISKKAAQDYATKLGLIPPKKDTDFNANTHDAEGRIKALQDQINSLKGKTVTVTTVFQSRGNKQDAQLARSGGGRGGAFSAAGFAAYQSAGGRTQPASVAKVELTDNASFSVYVNGVAMKADVARSERKAEFDARVGMRF